MKYKRKWLILFCTFAILIGVCKPVTVLAADAEWRMMHGEQDALVIGTVTEEIEEGYKVEVAQAFWCNQDAAKGRMIPIEEVPAEMIIEEIRYAFSYHGKSVPEVGDYIFISVDKKGSVWEQVWLAMEVSSTDPANMEFAQPENMTNSEYAWQIFVLSGGETTSFAFDGDDILYVDGEIVFDRAEYLKELKANQEAEEKALEEVKEVEDAIPVQQEESMPEKVSQRELQKGNTGLEIYDDGAASISIIGGADGPTSIFIAGKIGNGVIATVAIIAVIVVIAVVVVIRKILKRK